MAARSGSPGKSSDTARESLTLFRSGKTVAEIAALRTLAPTTIEGHLSFYVYRGEVDIRALVSPEKQAVIQETVNSYGAEKLGAVKGGFR